MAELKTRPESTSVPAFLASIADESRRRDCEAIAALMQEVTGAEPVMWGASIVGFGRYHYQYESGREGDWMLVGFSPRKKDITLYLMAGFERFPELMQKLGKPKTGKSCLYLKKLDDVDRDALRELVRTSVDAMAEQRVDR
ncbi:MAG TPA: DUF1801 domain-containing protein [Gemmatimonadaceae bacterium]|nr:DUF1801 domain-containing protein [Gemmatimonadaceae bacterium]